MRIRIIKVEQNIFHPFETSQLLDATKMLLTVWPAYRSAVDSDKHDLAVKESNLDIGFILAQRW